MTIQARGYKAASTLDWENGYNTAPATAGGLNLPINTNNLEHKQTLIESETITGSRNASQSSLGRKSVDGSIVVPADYRAIGAWLKALFGDPTTSGSAAPYTHIYKVTDNQPSFLLEKAFPDVIKFFLYHGCKLNTMKFSFGEDNEMTVELDILGSHRTIENAAYNDEATVLKKLPISQNHAYVKINNVESTIIKNGEFTLDGGLDGDQYVVGGGGVRGDIPEGIFQASGSLSALFKDTTIMGYADAGTTVSLEIGFVLGDNTSLKFLFPEVQVEPSDAPISGPAGVSFDFNWRAFHNSDSGNSVVVVTLKNDTGSY